MKIGVNTLFLVPGDVGGTETYLRETLKAAVKEYPEVDFILFTNNENTSLFQELFADKDNVRCICLRFNAARRYLRILFEQFLLPISAKSQNVDILWSPGYTSPLLSFCPQVVTVCDLQYKKFPEDMNWLERNVLNVLVWGACRRCDAVLAISDFSRQEIIKNNYADEDKVFTQLLGADPSFSDIISEREKERCLEQLSLGRRFILCVAHSYPHKKIDILVKAFGEIQNKISHDLVLVGKPRRGELRLQAALEFLDEKTRYRRFEGLPYRTLQILFQTADIFVLPSAYEGFGLPVVEAMLSGAPVITSREGALREVSGNHAYSVEQITSESLAERMLEISSLPPEKRLEKIADAQKWASKFTWQKSAQKMFEVFNLVLSQSGK